ncbi:MAG: hypothetical protein OEV64_13900 [Desulfobulbaceae bacterium]|nr:hypothetical protein [Desulfobulbaceae bacterium]
MSKKLRTSVSPDGNFILGLHKPSFVSKNLRSGKTLSILGLLPDGKQLGNEVNFPDGDIEEKFGKWIYEIPNAFAFRGTTYIDSKWAEEKAENPRSIRLSGHGECSLRTTLAAHVSPENYGRILSAFPLPLRYALAAESTDAEELVALAATCARFVWDGEGKPLGLRYKRTDKGTPRPDIDDFELFETIANNPSLPDVYKEVMVLRPGVQGNSEIVGTYRQGSTKVFEYLRRNSYIPWGHYAANMANDAVRYRIEDLSLSDMFGLRHLYYQRIMVILATELGLAEQFAQKTMSTEELEVLRNRIVELLPGWGKHPACLWGWNFGYNISASGYRLHASHQMIHQQYAMVPEAVPLVGGDDSLNVMTCYSCGDQVAEVVERYRNDYRSDFFTDYLRCLRENRRIDTPDKAGSLIIWEDENVLLFVPKAQVSQWEIQIMVAADSDGQPVGNIVEADIGVRRSLDIAIYLAQKILARLGARMVTSVEYSKRLGIANSQRLLYSLLPKLPWAMGAFSEAQYRFISGHYPEDFATQCKEVLRKIIVDENLSM